MPVSFNISREDALKIKQILDYAESVGLTKKGDRLHHQMDLTAVHANGCPLDFDKLATFDDFNLSHDIGGINRHLNRKTGQLENCFVPRCKA